MKKINFPARIRRHPLPQIPQTPSKFLISTSYQSLLTLPRLLEIVKYLDFAIKYHGEVFNLHHRIVSSPLTTLPDLISSLVNQHWRRLSGFAHDPLLWQLFSIVPNGASIFWTLEEPQSPTTWWSLVGRGESKGGWYVESSEYLDKLVFNHVWGWWSQTKMGTNRTSRRQQTIRHHWSALVLLFLGDLNVVIHTSNRH